MATIKEQIEQYSFSDKQTEAIIKGLFSDEYSYGDNIIEILERYFDKNTDSKEIWFEWFSDR